MTVAALDDVDHGRYRGEGVVHVYDTDKLLWAAGKACIASIDGRPVVRGTHNPFVRHRARQRIRRANPSGVWVPKFELDRLGITPDAEIDAGHNLFLTVGITRLWNLWAAQGGTQAFDATHTRVGAGNGSTAVVIGNTDLSAAAGSTNRWFQIVDAVPTITTNTCKYTSTFASADGNFAWNEWGIDQGTASGNTVTAPLFNRAVPGSSLGTKGAGTAWAFSVTLSLS